MKPIWPSHYTPPQRRMCSIDLIEFVAREFKTSPAILLGGGRTDAVCHGRALIASVLLSRGMSKASVGRVLKRDRSSVFNAVAKLDQYRQINPRTDRLYRLLMAKESV